MDRRVEFAITIMSENLGEEISVAAVSRRVRLSPTRLRQLFNREIGKPPLQFLRELRLEHAALLLKSTFLSVKEIAFISGSKDVNAFIRGFKIRYGVTPRVFRS
jgi:AraC-like DNA-binding protein